MTGDTGETKGADDRLFRRTLGVSLLLHLLLLLMIRLTPSQANPRVPPPFNVTFLQEEVVEPLPVIVRGRATARQAAPPPEIEASPRVAEEAPQPARLAPPLIESPAPAAVALAEEAAPVARFTSTTPAPIMAIAVAPPAAVVAVSSPREASPTTIMVQRPPTLAVAPAASALASLLADYRARVGRLLAATMNRRFQREGRRRDEGTVSFHLEIAPGGATRITEVVAASPLLERLTRVAIAEARVPAPPPELPAPLTLRYRTRFMLEGG